MNRVKIFSGITGLLVILAAVPGVAYAQTLPASRIQNIKTREDKLIDRITGRLNSLDAKINSRKNLSNDDKNQLLAQVQAAITGLNTLKVKADAEGNVSSLRADIKSLKVFRLTEVKIRLILAADTMSAAADRMTAVSVNLGTKIAKARAEGKNTDSLTNLLNDMKSKLADAKTQYANAENQLLNLDPNDSGALAVLKNVRGEIKTGAADLKTARQDMQQIRQGLKSLV